MHWISLVNSVVMGAYRTLRLDASRATPRRVATRGHLPEPPAALTGATVESGMQGREGRVVFRHRTAAFSMYAQFGGGDVIVTVDIPCERTWTRSTGLGVELRRPVLEFIGESLVYQHMSEGRARFEIHDRFISVHAVQGDAAPV